MILNKKIKLILLLTVCSGNGVILPSLGDRIVDRGLRGLAYTWNFIGDTAQYFGTVNPKIKLATIALATGFYLRSCYIESLKRNANSKLEKKKIDDGHRFTRTFTDVFKTALTYDATFYNGVACFWRAYYDEQNARGMRDAQQSSRFVLGQGISLFSSYEKAQIETVMSQVGLDHSKFVALKTAGSGGSASGTSNGGILFIGSELMNAPEKMKFVVAHEAAHLKENHLKKRAIAGAAIPVVIELGCRLLDYGTKKLIKELKRHYGMKKDGKVATALSWLRYCTSTLANSIILKGLLSFYFYHVYIRSQEKEADLVASRNARCAKGGIDYFQESLKSNLKYSETGVGYDSQGNYLGGLTHPYLTDRIAYLTPLAEEQARVV